MRTGHFIVCAAAIAALSGACKGETDPSELPKAPAPTYDGKLVSKSGSGWTIGCPEGWTIKPPSADATWTCEAPGGVPMCMMVTEGLGQDFSPETYWDFAKLHMEQEGLTEDFSKAVNVDGRAAVRAQMSQRNALGSVKILAYVYTSRKTAYLAMCFADPGAMSRHTGTFDAVGQSLIASR